MISEFLGSRKRQGHTPLSTQTYCCSCGAWLLWCQVCSTGQKEQWPHWPGAHAWKQTLIPLLSWAAGSAHSALRGSACAASGCPTHRWRGPAALVAESLGVSQQKWSSKGRARARGLPASELRRRVLLNSFIEWGGESQNHTQCLTEQHLPLSSNIYLSAIKMLWTYWEYSGSWKHHWLPGHSTCLYWPVVMWAAEQVEVGSSASRVALQSSISVTSWNQEGLIETFLPFLQNFKVVFFLNFLVFRKLDRF